MYIVFGTVSESQIFLQNFGGTEVEGDFAISVRKNVEEALWPILRCLGVA
jgi:hypothetical protein